MIEKKRIITPTIWLLSLVSLFADVASEMLYPVIPIYLQNIGFSVFLIGILEGVAEATAGFSKGYFGNWSDHIGRRLPFVRMGYFLSALSKPLMVVFTYPLWVFGARTTDRIGKGLRTAPRDALLSSETSPQTKAQVFSFHRGFDTLGAVFGPLIALAFIYFYPGKLTSLFYIAVIPGMLAVLITYAIKEKKFTPKTTQQSPGFFSYFKYWGKAPIEYRKLITPLIIFALFNSSDMLLLLKVKESTDSNTTTIMVYVFFNLVYAISSFPLGLLADRINMKIIFLGGLILFSISYFAMAQTQSNLAFYIIFGIYGLYMAATEGISKAWLSNMVKKEETGTAIGLFVALQSLSLMIASAFAGLIWSLYGAAYAFILTAIVSLLVFIYMLIFVRKPLKHS